MPKLIGIAAAFACVTLAAICVGADYDTYEEFVRDWKPKVGSEVTITGKLLAGKLGVLVQPPRGGAVYLRPTDKGEDKQLWRLFEENEGHKVRVTGKLLFTPRKDGGVNERGERNAGLIEHFHIDTSAPDASVSLLPRPKTREF